MTDAGLGDAQVAVADAGGAPRDPEAIVGAAGAIQADVILVMLVVNAEVIRQNPVGAQMGYLLRGIPQWNEFMSGTDIDPVRDADWVIVSGPSLINTAKDVGPHPLLHVRCRGRSARSRWSAASTTAAARSTRACPA